MAAPSQIFLHTRYPTDIPRQWITLVLIPARGRSITSKAKPSGKPTKIVLLVHGPFSHFPDGNRIGARRLRALSFDSSGIAGPTPMNNINSKGHLCGVASLRDHHCSTASSPSSFALVEEKSSFVLQHPATNRPVRRRENQRTTYQPVAAEAVGDAGSTLGCCHLIL